MDASAHDVHRGWAVVMDDVLEGFARASIRLGASDVDNLPLPPELRDMASRGRSGQSLALVIPNPDEIRLHELLKAVTRLLRKHEQTLKHLPGVEIDLFLGWAPQAEQETLIVDVELIGLLGRLDAPIVFDTYNE